MLLCFITALKPAPAFKGKVLVKCRIATFVCTCRHLHRQVVLEESSLLPRALRCHLVSYFRVYPKITYRLPSFWSVFSAITPRYAVDADDLPLSVVVTLTAAHFGSLRSQPGPGTSSLLTKPQLFTRSLS